MKHLFLLLLLSSTAFSQVRSVFATPQLSDYKMTLEVRPRLDTIPPYCNTAGVTLITYRPDTVRAKLLVTYTTRRWGVAHARDGFVVTKAGEVIAFFTDKMECFPPETELWKWREANKKIIKTRHARN